MLPRRGLRLTIDWARLRCFTHERPPQMKSTVLAPLLLGVLATPSIGAQMSVTVAGPLLNGQGPAFEVVVAGTVVGSAVFSGADTQETFSFDLPDDLLTDQPIRIVFTNDEATDAGNRDLHVMSAQVDDMAFPAEAIRVESGGQIVDRPVNFGKKELWSSGEAAVLLPSSGSWRVVEAAAAPVTPAAGCEGRLVVPFDKGMFILSNQTRKALEEFARQGSSCRAEIAGYSSTSGDPAINQAMSEARADAVGLFLQGKVGEITVAGRGETSEFGPTQADNRVVVVELR